MAPRHDVRDKAVDDAMAALRQATGVMFARWRKLTKQRGTTPPQIWLIRILHARGSATSKELAEEMCVTPASITGLVAKLERHGFVTRKRDPHDRRVVRLQASPKAVLGLEAMRKEGRARAAQAFNDWSVEDIKQLTAMLQRLSRDAAEPDGATGARRQRPRRP